MSAKFGRKFDFILEKSNDEKGCSMLEDFNIIGLVILSWLSNVLVPDELAIIEPGKILMHSLSVWLTSHSGEC